MTASTEQLHQLLELVLTELDRKAIPIAYMQDIDRKGKAFIEQAARRAQVVSQSVIDKIVPAIEPEGLCEEKHHCEWALYKDRERIRRELAASPKPPEAAPVQMPEPKLTSRGILKALLGSR